MMKKKQSTNVIKTESLCPRCLKVVPAVVSERQGKMIISKKCDQHGKFESPHFWHNPKIYHFMKRLVHNTDSGDPDGLVVDVTYNCNMTCPFCWLSNNVKQIEDPSLEDLFTQIDSFSGSSIYLCGGEPTLRPDLPIIIKRIKALGKTPIIFTNGLKLADAEYVRSLKAAGLEMIIYSLNSFDHMESKKFYGEDILENKLIGLKNAISAGILLELYVIIKKGLNEKQVKTVLEYVSNHNSKISMVNFQTLWENKKNSDSDIIAQSEILNLLHSYYGICLEDFLQSTTLSYYFFEINRKIFGKSRRRSPRCEIKVYTLINDGSLTPINKVIDIQGLNARLENLNSRLDKRREHPILTFLLHFPYIFLIKQILFKKTFKHFTFKNILSITKVLILEHNLSAYKIKGVVSIMLGRFHDRYNIDLDFVKTCTLYASKDKYNYEPFCMREILQSRG